MRILALGAGCAAVLLVACLEPDAITCADGTLCPSGFQCGADGSCVTEAQVAACADARDEDPCSIPGVEAGSCRGGVCVAPRCGNGFVEPASGEQCDDGAANSAAPDAACRLDCQPARCGDGVQDGDELCDDHNQISGDGCSSDCVSLETCGNEYVDTVVGEQCDAGAGLSHDGCASQCLIEIDTGRQVDSEAPARRGAAAATGPDGRPIFFGGHAFETTFGDTWRWDGAAWLPLQPATSPSPRRLAAMAFDGGRGRVVLFGGQLGDGQPTNDTWEWDGTTWTEVVTADAPTPRAGHALTFDKGRMRTVLFGGELADGTRSNETWEFDGVAWTQRSVALSPPARRGHAMAYDFGRGVITVFGGWVNGLAQDTWEWDGGNAWVQRAPATVPPAVVDCRLVYDSAIGALILVGGEGSGGAIANAWRWSGSTWGALPNAPAPRHTHVLVADEVDGASLLFGGESDAYLDVRAETFRFDGAWAAAQDAFAPAGRNSAGLAYDQRRDRVVMFGGLRFDARLGDTWEHRGGVWIPRDVAGPPPRGHHGMAYDVARGETVVFGGFSNLGSLADTWVWDGEAWTERHPATAPSERSHMAMTYDAGRARIVLFGGDYLGDTWEWDGASWLERTPAVSPPTRSSASLAYDPRRARVVLFGGYHYEVGVGEQLLADTWEWDGEAWTEVVPADGAPPARYGAAMAYDASRGATVLLGGAGNAAYLADAWAWDGARWRALAPTDIFTPRTGVRAVYEPGAASMLAFGGNDGIDDSDERWRFRLASASAPAEACAIAGDDSDGDGLAGCDDPDCWRRCAPACPPGAPCELVAPRCGDAACAPTFEDYLICPADCPAP